MVYGRQPQIEHEVDWVTDEDDNVLGYQKSPKEFVWIVATQTDPNTGGIVFSAGGANISSRRDLRARDRDDFARKLPLIRAPLWTAGEVITYTNTYRRHSNGKLLLAVVAGTAGTVEPTYSESAAITDNTVTWVAVGRSSRVNTDGYQVPTITTGTSIAGLTAIPLWTNQGLYSSPTCPNLVNGAGGNSTQSWCFDDGGTASVQGIAVGKRGHMSVKEFVTDAPKLAIGCWNSAGVRNVIYVDDYPIEEAPTPHPSGNPSYYTIDWSGSRQDRKYRIESAGVANITGIAIDSASTLRAAPVTGLRGVWVSDSYGGTVSTYSCPTSEYLSERVMRRIGVRYTRNLHIGGTGYTVTGSGTGSPFSTAGAVMSNNPNAGWNPDVVVIAHGFNDLATDVPSVVAAAQSAWRTARSQYPAAAIVVSLAWSGATGPSGGITTLNAALLAAFQSWADPMSVCNVPASTTSSYVTGTGKWGATTGTGNSDIYIGADGVHPSFIGRQYLEDRLVRDIDAALAAIGF